MNEVKHFVLERLADGWAKFICVETVYSNDEYVMHFRKWKEIGRPVELYISIVSD